MATGRGGSGRGQGRKPLDPLGGESKMVTLRMTQEQARRLRELGGADWVRRMVDHVYLSRLTS